MQRTLHLPILLLLAAAPAAAQNTIRPGESVTGQLTASDPVLDDGSHYDVWRFAGVANHRYRVTLRSTDFDAYLSVGTQAAEGCTGCASNDDGAGGTDAQVQFTGRADGTYEIRANSYDAERTGGYELTLEDEGVAEDAHEHGDAPERGTPIALSQQVTGELTRFDRKQGASYSDTWTYDGRAGEAVIITLRSEDFDAYLAVGAYEGGECTEMYTNNNGGGGTDSQLRIEFPDDGAYHIHVTARDQGDTGPYTLLIEPDTQAQERDPIPMPIAPDETLEGRLTERDDREADGSYRDTWTFMGQVGVTYTVTLRSADFDAYLWWGRLVTGEWEVVDSDDDSAGGSDARLTFTAPVNGEYALRAGSYEAGQTGTYTITLEQR